MMLTLMWLRGRIARRAAAFEPRCWWCAHPETHDDDTGCQHPGCPCTGLL